MNIITTGKNPSDIQEYVQWSATSFSLETQSTPQKLLDVFDQAKEVFAKENITNDTITELIDKNYDTLNLDSKQKKLLDYIIIEFWQNITKHWIPDIDIGQLQKPMSKISLRVGTNELYLETENYIESPVDTTDSIQDFAEHIKKVGNMWYEELQAEHIKVLNEEDTKYDIGSEESRKKWAWLGFIDVARKIKKMYKHIWQIFVPVIEKVNDHISKFRLITKIPLLTP